MTRLFAHPLPTAQSPTAGGRCNAFAGHFMVPPTATVSQVSTLQKRPPVTPKACRIWTAHLWCDGRSGAARRRVPRLDSARVLFGEADVA